LLDGDDLRKELEAEVRATQIPELLADDQLLMHADVSPKEESDMPESFRPFVQTFNSST